MVIVMFGMRVDRAAGGMLAATAFYLLFLNAWRSVPLACALAFFCALLLRHLTLRRPPRRKCAPSQAEAALEAIAALPEGEAAPMLETLVRPRLPDAAFNLVPILRLPDASLSAADVFHAWKTHRDAQTVVVAATCRADPRALSRARECESPRVIVVDAPVLRRLMRAQGVPERLVQSSPGPAAWLRRVLRRIMDRPVRPRSALLALSMLAIYLAMGNPLYLFSSMALLFRLGAALIRRGFAFRRFT